MSMIICIVCDYWHTKRTYIKLRNILTASETNERKINNNCAGNINFNSKPKVQVVTPNEGLEFMPNEINKLNTVRNGKNKHYNCDNLKLYENVSTNDETQAIMKNLHLRMDGMSAIYLIRELEQYQAFRHHIYNNRALRNYHIIYLHVVTSTSNEIDFKWCNMLLQSIYEKIEIDCLMSWLSTLGGGFSALGEQFNECAKTAGKISLKQLQVGLKLGDPFLQARCKLYYSLSLLQMGRLRAAKYLIRQQYKFARQHKETDTRLLKMCRGIWLRLQYEYRMRRNCGSSDKLLKCEKF